MVEKDDIESLLQTGSWRTSRSRSPNPHGLRRQPYEPPKSNIGAPRTVESGLSSKRPPPPSVEDEEESLAKEHLGSIVSDASDEEPKYRGDIDQQPILLPVHEHNPERRFVIVPGRGGADAPDAEDSQSSASKVKYEANICRKYVLVTPQKSEESDKEPKKKLDLPKRKSHQDLPRLTTDFGDAEPSMRRSSSRRGREKPLVDQEPRTFPSSRERTSAKAPDSAFLSPSVKHTAGRRDRAYWDFGSEAGGRSARSSSARRDARLEVTGNGNRHHSAYNYPSSPSHHRRASSAASMPNRDGPTPDRPRSYIEPYGFNGPDDILAFMAPGDDFFAGRQGREASPPRRTRNSNSPPHPRGAREMPGPSPNRRRQPRSATKEQDGYSSDGSYRERRPSRHERSYPARDKLEPDYPFLLSPEKAREANPKLGALPDDSPLPSPRSATFPVDKSRRLDDRSISPSPPSSRSPSRRAPRTSRVAQPGLHSRDASISSASNGSASLPYSMPNSFGRNNTADKRPLPGLVPSLTRQESSDPRSPVLYWQASRDEDKTDTDNHISFLGRYSQDVQNGVLSQFPDCRWKHPTLARNRAGSDQFLTLKRAENFRICPDCYAAVFARTDFRHLFVPAPARSPGQLISCDFGSSPWYPIAFVMTLKHRYPDLRLLQAVASVAARTQACAGSQAAMRIWYSIMAPNSRLPIQSFGICWSCAKTVEALFPNLAGVFVPLDSHEPSKGICELRFSPERKRFYEYLVLMEETSDRALSRRAAPDIAQLADRIREISLNEECLRNTPVPNRKWHVMQRIPEFTVCEECFDAVVWPMIEDEDDSDIPRNFYKSRQLVPVAACQLYSERMRRVFRRACRYNDFEYLASHVLERLRVLAEIKARYNELQREDPEDPEVQKELANLARQFKEVE
ncbi:hypothetical protein VTK56DRAFT_59 [Thermocarpiscus australiensis]